MSKLGDSFASLGERQFRLLFTGQAVSVVGSMFRVVALPFAVLAIGGTATDIGIVEAAGLVPLALLVLVGGVWADRLPRRWVMLDADLARTVLQLAAAGLLIGGVAHVWHLAVLQVGMGIAEAFFGPAYTGLVPEVVSPPRLQQANALQGLVSSGAITLGAFLAGMLVAALGAGWAIGIDGLSYLASAWFLLRLRPAAFLGRPSGRTDVTAMGPALAGEEAAVDAAPAAGGRSFFRDLAAGWREFTSHTWIWVMVVGAAAFLFAIDGPIQVLGPIVARDAYDGARTWGVTSAAMGIGQIAGGLLSLRWRPRRPMLVIAAGMSLTALPVVFLALEAPVWTLYLSLAAVGVEWGLYDPFWLTCMQREVAPHMISRVSAYDYLGVLAFYPAGLALAGPLADSFGRATILWFSAGVAILVSVFQLAWRDVRAPHDMGPAGAPTAPADGPA
ncbi:MAG TPA: MFS transporter [Thermoleophilia bacterium]|nr:MFS transporter [Thermoleophilia bacterium]